MGITAKELAAKLGLSATAISMALNNKPGVSTETRNTILKAAEKYGYDFTKLKKEDHYGPIYIVFYRASNAILSYNPIFDELWEGIMDEAAKMKFTVRSTQFYEKSDTLEDLFGELRLNDCSGIILVGTEIRYEVAAQFAKQKLPMVLLDSYFDALDVNSVLINNGQGAYNITDYLISKTHAQPGYLKASYRIQNFEARSSGFYKAVKENGMSTSRSIVHELTPTIEGAYADMMAILEAKDPIARCYFADNDAIAVGAMRAFKAKGYRIPEDVAIGGFDNISESSIIEPPLTTMDVPRFFIGKTSATLLIEQIIEHIAFTRKVAITTKLIKRGSI